MAAGFTIGDIINQSKKGQQEKDLHPIKNYEEAKNIILKSLQSMSEQFISVGYYLKLIRDQELFRKDGFEDIWDFAKNTYGIGMSTASRWMKMNDKYSVDGNSPYLQDKYKGFKKSQLQEMLYLSDEQMEQVGEEMTVREIREIRQPEPEVKEEAPRKETQETFTTSQIEDHPIKWFIKQYIKRRRGLEKIAEIFKMNRSNEERGKAIQKLEAPYGYGGFGDHFFDVTFYGYAKGLCFKADDRKQHIDLTYIKFVKLLDDIYGPIEYEPPEEVETVQDEITESEFIPCESLNHELGIEEPDEIFATSQIVEPEDKSITTEIVGRDDFDAAIVRHYLNEEQSLLKEMIELDGLPEITILKQKIIVSGLSLLVDTMEKEETDES